MHTFVETEDTTHIGNTRSRYWYVRYKAIIVSIIWEGSPELPISWYSPSLQGNHHSHLYQLRWVLPILELHRSIITQYVLFCVWILSLNTMSMRFIHVAVPRTLFLRAEEYSIVWLCHHLSILLLINIWDIFSFGLAILNNATINILTCVVGRQQYSFMFNIYTWEWSCWAIRYIDLSIIFLSLCLYWALVDSKDSFPKWLLFILSPALRENSSCCTPSATHGIRTVSPFSFSHSGGGVSLRFSLVFPY